MTDEKRASAGNFWKQQGWAYALLVAAGLGLGAYAISTSRLAARLATEGIEGVGQVTNKSESRGNKSSNRTYQMSYSFITPEDPYTHGKQNVSKAFYDAQTDGGDIRVLYLPSDPTISAVEPGKIANAFWPTLGVSIALVLGGLAGGGYALSRARA